MNENVLLSKWTEKLLSAIFMISKIFSTSLANSAKPFWIALLKMKFGIQFKSNMLHLMGIFTFSVLDQKYPFWVYKICCFKWNLVPRLIRISWIRCWLSRFVWSNNTLFGQIWFKKWKDASFLKFSDQNILYSRKLLIFSQKKAFPIFQTKWDKTSKKIFIFQKRNFLMFQETSYFSGTNLPSSKNKNNSLLKKVSYISGKLNFSDPSLKNFLYFSWNEENPRSSHCSFWSLDKKTSRTFHGYNFYFKWHNCIRNRGSGKF